MREGGRTATANPAAVTKVEVPVTPMTPAMASSTISFQQVTRARLNSPTTPLATAIRQTLAYFDVFAMPVTLEQANQFLFAAKADQAEVFCSLEKLRDQGLVTRRGNFYCLAGREEILLSWPARARQAHVLWRQVRRQAALLQLVPYVKAIMVCNKLAVNNINAKADIDLFVVMQRNRMWLGRLLLSGWLQLLGLRRHDQKIARRYCLSFFVTEDRLDLASITLRPYDIHLAYWLRQMVPITGLKTYHQLQAANRWVINYLPNFTAYHPRLAVPVVHLSKAVRWLMEKVLEYTGLGWLGNYWSRRWLYPRAMAKQQRLGPKASVVISDTMQKFHNIDRRADFREQFEQRLQQLGLIGE